MGDQTEPGGTSPTLVKLVTFATQITLEICYLCYPNYIWNLLPLLPKLHLKFVTFATQITLEIYYLCYPNYTRWMKLVRDVRDCLWKNKVFFFFFLFLLFNLRLCLSVFLFISTNEIFQRGTATTKKQMTNSIMIKCSECNVGWAHPRKYLRCCQRWWANRKQDFTWYGVMEKKANRQSDQHQLQHQLPTGGHLLNRGILLIRSILLQVTTPGPISER